MKLGSQIDRLPTFDWSLQRAEQDMSRASAAAERFRIKPDALVAASDALRKLQLAAAATQLPPPTTEPDPQAEDGQASAAQADEPHESIPPLASLKLLRGLQHELNQQTQQLATDPDPIWRNRRLSDLSQQQLALGEQLGQLLQEINAQPNPQK